MPRRTPEIRSLIGLPDDQQLTLHDVANVLNVHYTTAYDLVCSGAMPFLRIGTRVRVEVSALREYIDRRRVAPAAPMSRALFKHSSRPR